MDRILRDVFRGENYTLVWNYGEEGLESIGITFFKNDDRSRQSYGGRPSYGSRRTFQRNLNDETPQAVTQNRQRKFIGRRPLPNKRGTTPTRVVSSDAEEDEESSTPPKPVEDESSEDEDDSEDESIKEDDAED